MGYLCLTRRKGDSFYIGKDNEIEIKIAENNNLNGAAVKVCIKAPKEIPIVRKELIERNFKN